MATNSVYIETSVVSYLVARPSRDLVTASRQQVTRIWWDSLLPKSDPCVSEIVEQEIREGDSEMVKLRLEAITGFRFLAPLPIIDPVIASVAAKRILPPKALSDLAHLTFAAAHAVPLVVTWNFRHLANPKILPRLRREFAALGFTLPEVFTPGQLLTMR
jgi:hypothetical protein